MCNLRFRFACSKCLLKTVKLFIAAVKVFQAAEKQPELLVKLVLDDKEGKNSLDMLRENCSVYSTGIG